MPRLRILIVPEAALAVGKDDLDLRYCLPRSIERLMILKCTDLALRRVISLTSFLRDDLPSLKTIALGPPKLPVDRTPADVSGDSTYLRLRKGVQAFRSMWP